MLIALTVHEFSHALAASLLGEAGVNIATFALGRDRAGGSAVALVAIDGAAPEATLASIQSLPGVKRVVAMKF